MTGAEMAAKEDELWRLVFDGLPADHPALRPDPAVAAVLAEREAWRSTIEKTLGPSAARDVEEALTEARGQK